MISGQTLRVCPEGKPVPTLGSSPRACFSGSCCSAVAVLKSGTGFTSIRKARAVRQHANDHSLWRAGATSAGTTSIVRIFCLQSRRRARCRAGPWAFCKLRDDGIVPLICPTCQNVFAGFAQSIHASDRHATLHGVVFDILVGSQSRVGPCGCLSR